jgi:hypothetical protein
MAPLTDDGRTAVFFTESSHQILSNCVYLLGASHAIIPLISIFEKCEKIRCICVVLLPRSSSASSDQLETMVKFDLGPIVCHVSVG